MGDLNNGWTVKNQKGKEPSFEVTPALEGLGISYDGNSVEGRESTQDQPFTDKNGNPRCCCFDGLSNAGHYYGGVMLSQNKI